MSLSDDSRSTSLASPLLGVRMARIPRSSLPALAMLRGRADLSATFDADGQTAWISWDPRGGGADGPASSSEVDEVVEALLPVPGVVLYREVGGRWRRVGRRLPEFRGGPPDREAAAEARPIARVVVPDRVRAEAPAPRWRAARLRVVRDDRRRPTSAAIVSAEGLRAWAESAPTASIRGLRAARSGDRVLLLGRRLPPIEGRGRSWGARVLLPIGHRAEPALPEPMLAEAIGLPGGHLALIGADGLVEFIPEGVLEPLSRASARRMAGVIDRVPDPSRGARR